jgi:PhnB protein
MHATPYLNFPGNCTEAFRFYERVLGGKIVALMTHGDSPMKDQFGPGWQDTVMHAHLEAGDVTLLASDAPPDHYRKPQGFAVSLHVDAVDDAERIYAALSEEGEIRMPLQETFWSPRFAMFSDRFGTPWIINMNPET